MQSPKLGQFINGVGLVSSYANKFEPTSSDEGTTKKPRKRLVLAHASSTDFDFLSSETKHSDYCAKRSFADKGQDRLDSDVFILEEDKEISILGIDGACSRIDEKSQMLSVVTVRLSASCKGGDDECVDNSFVHEKTVFISNNN